MAVDLNKEVFSRVYIYMVCHSSKYSLISANKSGIEIVSEIFPLMSILTYPLDDTKGHGQGHIMK